MKSFDLALAREKLLYSAPEYVADYLGRIADEDRFEVLRDDGFLRRMQGRQEPVVDMVLARYLGQHGVEHAPNSSVWNASRLSEMVAVALMASPRRWTGNWPHDPDRDWSEIPDLAKAALGENPDIHFGWLAAAVAGKTSRKMDGESLFAILSRLVGNPSFQSRCWYPTSLEEEPSPDRETSLQIDREFDVFIASIIAEMSGPPPTDAGTRAAAFVQVFAELPKVVVPPADALAGAEQLEAEWNLPELTKVFGATVAVNSNLSEVRSLLDQANSIAFREGLYRGVQTFIPADVEARLARDGMACARGLAVNPAGLTGADEDERASWEWMVSAFLRRSPKAGQMSEGSCASSPKFDRVRDQHGALVLASEKRQRLAQASEDAKYADPRVMMDYLKGIANSLLALANRPPASPPWAFVVVGMLLGGIIGAVLF